MCIPRYVNCWWQFLSVCADKQTDRQTYTDRLRTVLVLLSVAGAQIIIEMTVLVAANSNIASADGRRRHGRIQKLSVKG